MAVMKSMVVPGRIKVQYWLTLVKKAAPFQLGKYFSLSKKVMNNVLPKVVKESIPTFESSFDNKIRSLRVLYKKWQETGKLKVHIKCLLAEDLAL